MILGQSLIIEHFKFGLNIFCKTFCAPVPMKAENLQNMIGTTSYSENVCAPKMAENEKVIHFSKALTL